MKVCRYSAYLFPCEIKYEGKTKNSLCGKFRVYRYVHTRKSLTNWKNQKDMIAFSRTQKRGDVPRPSRHVRNIGIRRYSMIGVALVCLIINVKWLLQEGNGRT